MTEIIYEKTREVDLNKKELLLNGEFDMGQFKKPTKKSSSKSPTKHCKSPSKKNSKTDAIFEAKLMQTSDITFESGEPTQVQLERWDKVASKTLPEIDYLDMVQVTANDQQS